MKLKSELEQILQTDNTIAIAGHVRPDGDCIGACLGLYHYIKANYPDKELTIYLEQTSKKFSYLKEIEEIKHDCEKEKEKSYDCFFMLDCGETERLGFSGIIFQNAKKTVCIDHHISSGKMADKNYIFPEASATCEILFDFMEEDKIPLDSAIALYTGLIHDTGVFKHSNTTQNTMEIAGKLIAKGVPFTEIINNSFYQKTYIQNQILGRALLESIVFFNGTCIFTALRQKDMEFYGASSDDLDGIVDQLKITKGIICAIFLYESEPQKYKVSLRSEAPIDVSKIAKHFGGGGHIRAAGCSMLGSVHDVINNLSSEIEKQMQEWNKGV